MSKKKKKIIKRFEVQYVKCHMVQKVKRIVTTVEYSSNLMYELTGIPNLYIEAEL